MEGLLPCEIDVKFQPKAELLWALLVQMLGLKIIALTCKPDLGLLGWKGQTTSQTREAGSREAAAVVGSAALFHPSRHSFLQALIRGGVCSYQPTFIYWETHSAKLKGGSAYN